MEVDELEEVKTIVIVILKLGQVMPHSGVAATLNRNPTKKYYPPKKSFPPQNRKKKEEKTLKLHPHLVCPL